MRALRLRRQLALLCAPLCLAAADLRIFAIDVEGGKSTLYVAPSGESMLVDSGYAGYGQRDADRIVAAARAAGIQRIDYLVITHYHKDHVGGVPQLAARLPIGHFIDHGPNFEEVKDNADLFKSYVTARAQAPHQVVKPGDTIPIGGLEVVVVAAAGAVLEKPLAGAGQPNPQCAGYQALEPDTGENARSIGLRIRYGAFRVADLGDLYWNQEHDLACPENKLGPVNLYLSTHHGKETSGSPCMVWALAPRVAIFNNGPDTGAAASAWRTVHDSPGLAGLWQLHYATANDAAHNAGSEYIANTADGGDGNWIEVTAHADGSFSVTNGRNRYTRRYEP